MHHITIHHNKIHNNYDGINIGAFDFLTWSPSPFTHHNITIQHNEIYDNHYRGIDFWCVSDSTVAHNEIHNNGQDGITWVWVSNSTATHNTINQNSKVGLSINDSINNAVIHNDVTNNMNIGILLAGWGRTTTGNQFVRNDAQNNPSWDIAEYGSVSGNKWVKNKYKDTNTGLPPQ